MVEEVVHLFFRRCGDVLLRTELQIPLMFRFSADINHAGFVVFKNVEGFALRCPSLEFVARQRGVSLLLLCGLWSACMEASCREQRLGVICSHAGAAGKESDTGSDRNENEARLGYFRPRGRAAGSKQWRK